ncbi:MAG: glycosyltransferase family 4 protein [Deltaproteobacteria bacterium]|nr:glycosyltransferase family 4 protein [Deltaproteobacteria bacterium]
MSQRSVLLVSRCAWTLTAFRTGLMRELLTRGWRVSCAGAADGYEGRIQAMGVPFTPLPLDMRGMNPAADLRYLGALAALYRRARPDVIHHFTIKPVIYGGMAARLTPARVVNTITGLGYMFTGPDRGARAMLARTLYRVGLSSASHTWFLNAEDRDYFLKHRVVGSEQSGVLPGEGVDSERFSPRKRPSGGPPMVVYVGRILGDKGLYELAEAAERVKREIPRARFLLVGPRDERNPSVVPETDLRGWVDRGVFEWAGPVDDVRPHLAGADVVVLPSYREGLPMSLLEAMAMERAVAATDVPGCREVVEHEKTGLLVPPRNPRALAQALVRLLSDPGLAASMGKAGRQRVLAHFDEKKVIRRVLESYEA